MSDSPQLRRTLLMRAIETLPKDQQLVLALRYQNDRSFEEIENILQIPITDVADLHERAITELQPHLGH